MSRMTRATPPQNRGVMRPFVEVRCNIPLPGHIRVALDSFIPAGRLGTAPTSWFFQGVDAALDSSLFWRRLLTIQTKVSGVSFENRDGSERQRIIAKCKAGDRLYLRHDPDNEYSDFAIEVHHGPPGHETQIGFLEDDLASNLLNHLSVNILDVTGGTRDKPTRGVNMEILLSGSEYLEEEEPERGFMAHQYPEHLEESPKISLPWLVLIGAVVLLFLMLMC